MEVAKVLRLGLVKLIVVLFITSICYERPSISNLISNALVMSTCKQADMEGMANFMDGETNLLPLEVLKLI